MRPSAFVCCALVVFMLGASDSREVQTAGGLGQSSQGERTACRLLTPEEITALVEKPVALRNLTESEATYSACQWEDKSGFVLFAIRAYWKGGRQQFDIWRKMQLLGDDIFAKTEGVRTDSIVKQGPVRGIGDAAYFSELFPSLVLKGDTMLELTMSLVPKAGTKFRTLATKLVSRL